MALYTSVNGVNKEVKELYTLAGQTSSAIGGLTGGVNKKVTELYIVVGGVNKKITIGSSTPAPSEPIVLFDGATGTVNNLRLDGLELTSKSIYIIYDNAVDSYYINIPSGGYLDTISDIVITSERKLTAKYMVKQYWEPDGAVTGLRYYTDDGDIIFVFAMWDSHESTDVEIVSELITRSGSMAVYSGDSASTDYVRIYDLRIE